MGAWLQTAGFAALDGLHSLFGCPLLDVLMPVLSLLGEYGIVSILLGVLLLAIPKTRKAGLSLAIALIFGGILGNLLLKPLVGRLRPYQVREGLTLLVPALRDGSFPSGHALVCFETATVLSLRFGRAVGIPAFVTATAVAFSRLYLYMHFPSDVLAGMLLGILLGAAACFTADGIVTGWEKRKKKRQ